MERESAGIQSRAERILPGTGWIYDDFKTGVHDAIIHFPGNYTTRCRASGASIGDRLGMEIMKHTLFPQESAKTIPEK